MAPVTVPGEMPSEELQGFLKCELWFKLQLPLLQRMLIYTKKFPKGPFTSAVLKKLHKRLMTGSE